MTPENPPAARIGIDARKIRDFGIGRHLEGLLGALAARDDRETFTLFTFDGMRESLPGSLPHVLDPARFRFVAIKAPLYSLREFAAFRGVAPRHRLDLLHFPHYVRAFAPGCPVTVTVHDAIHLEEPPSFAAKLYARVMMGWAARSAAALFTVSNAARADLERLVPESRGRWNVVPNGVDRAQFAPPPPDAVTAFRRQRGLERDFTLVVASHRAHKNLRAAVHAFARSALADALLVLPARDDDAARRLASFLQGVDAARLLTPVDDADLPLLYAAARIVLAPSRREGFGLPALEACACGAAVLASPIPAHREVLGDAAEFAASPSADDMAAALTALWKDAARRDALSRAGPARAAKFTWNEAAELFLEGWRATIARGSLPRVAPQKLC